MIDSIIFDLDGTLWNAVQMDLKCFASTLSGRKEIKRPVTKEELENIMGCTAEEAAEKLLPYLDKKTQLSIMDECCKNELVWIRKMGGQLYDGLEDTLKKLSGKYSLFIVSNCQCGYIEAFYDYHKLDKYFKGCLCSGDTGLSKGENIKLIIEKYKLKKPVYVGDTQKDCDAAKIAQVPFIYASYGFGKVDSFDCRIDSIKDLPEAVKVGTGLSH